MKRILVFSVLLLILISNVLAKSPETELFLLPDQGFIRVDAHLLLDINEKRFTFKLFPDAQITAVWTPKLAGYSLERTAYYTLVTVELEELNEQVFFLDLSYEGFIDGYHDNQQNLDSELLWFPLFDKPFANLPFKMTIPKEHSPIIKYDTVVQELSAYSIFSWEVNDLHYPVILFSEQTVAKDKVTPEIQEPASDEPEITEPEVIEQEVIEPDVTEQEGTEQESTEPDVSRSALLDTIKAWDEAVSNKNHQILSLLIHSDFPNKEQYLEFLMKKPVQGGIVTEFEDITMESSHAVINGYLVEAGVANYSIYAKWVLANDQWFLRDLKMIPTIAPELEKWVNQLITAMTKKNLIWLDQHLLIENYRQSHDRLSLIQFLITVNIDDSNWHIQGLPNEGYQLTLIAQEEETGARLGLVYSLVPDQSDWKIADLKVIGFYP